METSSDVGKLKAVEEGINVVSMSSADSVHVEGANLGSKEPKASSTDRFGKMIAPGFYMEVGAKREEDAAMHAASFSSAVKTEEMFKFLQLTSCCFFSLSHGANDVANAVGPFAAVWAIYSSGKVSSKAPVPLWVLLYGGLALDVGLLTMGHHIMAALGNRLTLQTPSRGFCIELVMIFVDLLACWHTNANTHTYTHQDFDADTHTHSHKQTHTGGNVYGDGSFKGWCTRLHYALHHWCYCGRGSVQWQYQFGQLDIVRCHLRRLDCHMPVRRSNGWPVFLGRVRRTTPCPTERLLWPD